ncbi:MAG: hypothetical protein IJN48_04510 [Clostridia bacterium]|nr:hypothetical protein [Clostridia bacterium]
MNKKFLNSILLILAYATYVLLWCAIFFILIGMKIIIGYPTLISDAFGLCGVYHGTVFTIVAVLSPIWLWRINGFKRVGAAFLVILIYVAVSIGAISLARAEFKEFTPQKWAQYPAERWIMASDMFDIVEGMNYDSATILLGSPDYEYADCMYYYCLDGQVELYLNSEGEIYTIDVH